MPLQKEKETGYRRGRKTKKVLKEAICRAKSGAWKDFFEDLYRDPWGRLYRTVRTKLSQKAPPTESYELKFIFQTVARLFSADMPETSLLMALAPEQEPEERPGIPLVTVDEMEGAVDRLGRKKKASRPVGGPDILQFANFIS